MVIAEILGPDVLIVLAIVALLFGSSQLPKLARSLGSASTEFKKGQTEGVSVLAKAKVDTAIANATEANTPEAVPANATATATTH